jgi:hypothetical protein
MRAEMCNCSLKTQRPRISDVDKSYFVFPTTCVCVRLGTGMIFDGV